MVDLLGGIDYDRIKQKVLDIITAKDFKVLIIDSDGNVVSDAKLSDIFGDLEALKGALQSVNTDNVLIVTNGSNIQQPTDLQSILNYVEEKYGLDETVAQSITLDKGGFKTVDVYAKATAPTTFTVEYSYNGTDWDVYYESKVPEKKYKDTIRTAARYIRLSSAAAGAAGDTVDLVIAAVP